MQKKFFTITSASFVLITVLLMFVAYLGSPRPLEAQTSATSTETSTYVGADTCATCHDEIAKNLKKTRHGNNVVKATGGVEAHTCETCHGPGAEHVESGGDKTKIFNFHTAAPEAIVDRCSSCHASKPGHFQFKQSDHGANGVTCLSCHSIHAPKEARRLLVDKQPNLCYGCHTESKAAFSMPFRHRVNEGVLRCTDCHDVHGTSLQHSLRTTADQEAVCLTCHRNLHGPWVFEHVPVKTEGCTGCHQPHGSVNARLLKVSQVNLLCLQCHTPGTVPNTRTHDVNAPGTPASPVHDQSQKFQACTLCHVFIHGSNADETFMK